MFGVFVVFVIGFLQYLHCRLNLDIPMSLWISISCCLISAISVASSLFFRGAIVKDVRCSLMSDETNRQLRNVMLAGRRGGGDCYEYHRRPREQTRPSMKKSINSSQYKY